MEDIGFIQLHKENKCLREFFVKKKGKRKILSH